MTLQEQYDRANHGANLARKALRERPGNDLNLDHWAHRLVFWLDEASRLRKLAEADGHGFRESGGAA